MHYWNLEKIFKSEFDPLGVMVTPLSGPTTCISCFPDGKGFIVGSIEGRCGVKYVDLSENKVNGMTDYCFRCHVYTMK